MIRYSFELSEEAARDLKSLLDFEGNAFSDLVRVSGVSKGHDFIGADLSGVDFSGADLRGYNFSSADLTRAVGKNVLIDGTTLLDDARTDCSIFAHEAAKRRFLEADPQHEALLRKIAQEHWMAGALWAIKNLQRTSKNFANSAAIARFAYSEIKDITYKNQILYFLKDTFSSTDEYRDFLIGQAAQQNVNFRSLRPIVEILGKQFSRDPVVAQTLLSFLSHEEADIRAMCVPAVVTRSFFNSNKAAILSQMRIEPSAFVRSTYSQHFCRNHLPTSPALLFRPDESAYHDYAVRIDDKIYETLVRSAIRRAKRNARQNDGKNHGIAEVKWTELAQGLIGYKPYFQKLIDLGFPLKLTISAQSKMNASR